MSDVVQANVEPSPPRVQFGLRTLLTLPVVLAFSLVLLKYFSIFGLLAVFLAALTLQFAPWGDRRSAARQLAVDLAWGIVMPILCLLYDPMFFRESGSWGIFGYFMVGTQMLVLLTWKTVGRLRKWLATMLFGTLAIGVLTAVAVGFLLLPMSLVGLLFYGMGALGFTPWLAAYVFWRNTQDAYRHAGLESSDMAPLLVLLGAGFALAVPEGLNLLLGDVLSGWLASMGGFPGLMF